jgi:hypothetical protein
LNSTNGTFLEGAKLLSNVSEVWQPDQALTVGSFELKLQKGAAAPQQDFRTMAGVLDARTMGKVPAEQAFETHARQEPGPAVGTRGPTASIEINPSQVKVDPGMRTDTQVGIFNQGDLVEHYYITVQGIPSQWVTIPPTGLQLMPGTRGTLPIMFAPPRISTSSAGTHAFILRISSDKRGAEVARAEGILIITPFYQMVVDLSPKRLRKGGQAQFTIRNQGNAADSYTVTGRDREQALRFFPPSASASIPPGQSETIQFEVRPRRGTFIGTTKLYPLEFQAVAAGGEQQAQTQMGELVARPFLPIWLLVLLLLLCLLCLLLLLLLGPRLRGEEEATNTPDIFPITQTNQSIRDLLTATAEDHNALQESRNMTATAVQNNLNIAATQTVNAAATATTERERINATATAEQVIRSATETARAPTPAPPGP